MKQTDRTLFVWVKIHFLHLLIAILMISSFFNQYELSLFGVSPRVEHLFIVALFPLFGAYMLFAERRLPRLDLPTILLGAWILLNLISSVLRAPDPSDSYQHIIRFVLLGCVYVMVANAFTSVDDWLKGLAFWMLLITIEAVFGIMVTFSAFHFGTSLGVMSDALIPEPRPGGTIIEPNIFASLIVSGYLILTYLWLWQKTASKPVFLRNLHVYLLVILVLVLALLLARTRAAWLSAIAGLGLIYVWVSRRSSGLVFHNVVLNVGVLIIAFILSSLITTSRYSTDSDGEPSSFSSTLDTHGTVRQRREELELAFEDWKSSPIIGNGTGSFGQIHGPRYGVKAWVSNIFARALVDTGIVGFIFLVLFLGVTALYSFLHAIRSPNSPVGAISTALFIGMIALLVAYQATDASWLAQFWIHLGMMAAPFHFQTTNSDASSRRETLLPV